jgi:predicted methyltransferase
MAAKGGTEVHTAWFAAFLAAATLLGGRPSGAEPPAPPAAGNAAPRTERYIAMLERKERDVFQKPDEVMRTLALRPGERVADVGAGSGYFTLRIARAVGPTGQVLAIDINPDLLEFLARRAKEEGLANVTSRRVGKDDPDLPPAGIDTILMVDTFHYVKERAAYARKLRAGLAPGGRIVVIDYLPWAGCPGAPRPERRLSRESVDEAMAAAGLAPSRVHEFLPEQFFVEYTMRSDSPGSVPQP